MGAEMQLKTVAYVSIRVFVKNYDKMSLKQAEYGKQPP
jgi:hypothetical protein